MEKMEIQNVLFPFFSPSFCYEGWIGLCGDQKTKELHNFSGFWYESQGSGAERCLFGHGPIRVPGCGTLSQSCQCCKGTKPHPTPRLTEPLSLIISALKLHILHMCHCTSRHAVPNQALQVDTSVMHFQTVNCLTKPVESWGPL